jgi:oxygen-independent coproporphyrinogen-3 oxidase
MAGIYIHIPFCKQACHYCNFHFSTQSKGLPAMVAAMQQEIVLQQHYLQQQPVETVYFGGGTPSLLQPAQLEALLQTIQTHFTLVPGAEITLEANPDDIDAGKAASWLQAGINRLSIGIQSFTEADLRWMNRAHNAGQALQSIRCVQAAGFSNLTIDLIYGTPTLSDADWAHNVQQALELGIPHLSCYALTVEPETALQKMIALHKKEAVDPDKQGRHFEMLMRWMEEAGLEHYEISNFARPGYRSRHNSSYWSGSHYLGIGPSAHSYNGYSRQWNIANNALYLQQVQQGIVPAETEQLTAEQQQHEYVMTSLRTLEGLSLEMLEHRWGKKARAMTEQAAQKYLTRGQMVLQQERLVLTREGKLFADGIAADLFV